MLSSFPLGYILTLKIFSKDLRYSSPIPHIAMNDSVSLNFTLLESL